jgi:hypothetical protein
VRRVCRRSISSHGHGSGAVREQRLRQGVCQLPKGQMPLCAEVPSRWLSKVSTPSRKSPPASPPPSQRPDVGSEQADASPGDLQSRSRVLRFPLMANADLTHSHLLRRLDAIVSGRYVHQPSPSGTDLKLRLRRSMKVGQLQRRSRQSWRSSSRYFKISRREGDLILQNQVP